MDCIVHGVAESDTTEWLSHHFLLFLQPQIHANIQWTVRDALIPRTYHWGTSLVAQLLRLCASNAERGLDWSLAEELKIPHAAWGGQKAKTKTYHWNLWSPPSDTSNAPHWINTYGMQNTDTPSMFKERWPTQAPPSLGFSRQEHWSRLPFLLQGIFPTQEANLGLLHCRQILYHLSHDESPRILDRVDFLLCSGSSRALEPNLHLLQLRVDSLSPSHLGSPFPSVVSC